MESYKQLVMHSAKEMADSLADPINLVRQIIALKYNLDQQSARLAMTKALIQNAIGETVDECDLTFDERCDLEDDFCRTIQNAKRESDTRMSSEFAIPDEKDISQENAFSASNNAYWDKIELNHWPQQ